jgi:hypothetical protein
LQEVTKLSDEMLAKSFLDFIQSSAANVEKISDRLRTALNVPTGMEEVVRSAIGARRNIVIAGTAGSGKTHLLRTLGGETAGYRVVPDLAALPQNEWASVFVGSSPILVAGNEGAFIQGRVQGFDGYADVVSLLHATQHGEKINGVHGPVVIDVAAFDPASSSVLRHMVSSNLISDVIKETRSPEDFSGWQLLSDDTVIRRLERLVEVASTSGGGEGFTFRQLWKFVGDLYSGIPNEFWFERLTGGSSLVAERIREVFSPSMFPLPHVGNRMWYGDMSYLRGKFIDSAKPLLNFFTSKMQESISGSGQALEVFEKFRLFALFGLQHSPLDTHWNDAVDLWGRIRQQEVRPLVEAVNNYLAYGLIRLGDELELWCQHDAERRDKKPPTLLSFGRVPAKEFEIVRSRVFNNIGEDAHKLVGNRFHLRHLPSGSTMSITKDLIDVLSKTRSFKTDDREGVEYDWRIFRFISEVARSASTKDRLRVAAFDFVKRSARTHTWQISGANVRKVTS